MLQRVQGYFTPRFYIGEFTHTDIYLIQKPYDFFSVNLWKISFQNEITFTEFLEIEI